MTSSNDAPIPAPTAHLERRLVGWLIDIAIVAVLTGAVYLTGVIRISGCKPYDEVAHAFPPACPFANVMERVNDNGRTEQVYVLDNGREVPASTPTLFSRIVVDPPAKATYLLPLAYLVLVWGVFQGLTGWTPGRRLTGTRLVGADLRPPGIPRALSRLIFIDGLIALIGVAAGLAGQFWMLRFLAVNAAVGVVGLVSGVLSSGNHGLSDRLAGTTVVNAGDAANATRTTTVDFAGVAASGSQTSGMHDAAARAVRTAVLVDEAARRREIAGLHDGAAWAAATTETRPVGSASGAYADSNSNEKVERALETLTPLAAPTDIPAGVTAPSSTTGDPPPWRPRKAPSVEETSPPPLPPAVFGAPDNVSSAAATATGDVGQPPQDTEVPLLAAVPRRGPAIPAGLDFSPLPDGDTAPTPVVAAAMPAEPAATMPAETPEQQPAATTALTLAPGTEKAASVPSPAVAHALGGTNQTAPEWDAARRAYIFWNGNEWQQYDYARQTWGPISR